MKHKFTGCSNCEHALLLGNKPPCLGCACKEHHKNFKQYKEQEMSYKPTSSCTLKNIAAKIYEVGCSEAKTEWFDFFYEYKIKRKMSVANFGGPAVEVIIEGDVFDILTKTEKRRNWLLKFGFLEEEISLKPCPFCGSENTEYVSHAGTTFLRCIKCSSSGAVGSSLKKADEYWNTRK